MPALSPTMKQGAILEWHVAEGEDVTAMTAICTIETDKAKVDLECQDDCTIAKLLVEDDGDTIKVGTPIYVTVDEGEDIAPFKDFVAEAVEVAAEVEEPAAPTPTPT